MLWCQRRHEALRHALTTMREAVRDAKLGRWCVAVASDHHNATIRRRTFQAWAARAQLMATVRAMYGRCVSRRMREVLWAWRHAAQREAIGAYIASCRQRRVLRRVMNVWIAFTNDSVCLLLTHRRCCAVTDVHVCMVWYGMV